MKEEKKKISQVLCYKCQGFFTACVHIQVITLKQYPAYTSSHTHPPTHTPHPVSSDPLI